MKFKGGTFSGSLAVFAICAVMFFSVGFAYQMAGDASGQLEAPPPQAAAVASASWWSTLWCDIKGWFGYPCPAGPAVVASPPVADNTPPAVIVVESATTTTDGPAPSARPPATTISPSIQSPTTVIRPVEREIIREVIVRDGQADISGFVTRTEYDRQVDALLRSIESIDGGTTVINQGGGGGATVLEDLTDVASMSKSVGDLLTWNGTAWTNISTSSLGLGGGSSQWLNSGSDIYFNTGNVGVGTTTPISKLHVNGAVSLSDGTSDLYTTRLVTVSGVPGQPLYESSKGYYLYKPLVTGAPRVYLIPNGAVSGTTAKFELFNTDYLNDVSNYSGFNIFTNNVNNEVNIGPNRNGSVGRLKMSIGGDYVGSSLLATSSKIEFNTDNTLDLSADAIRLKGTSVGFGLIVSNLGNVTVGSLTSGNSRLNTYENNTGTGNGNGVTIEQAGVGDSLLHFLLTGTQRYTVGIDNSDGDKFKIGTNADLGTSNVLTITNTGNVGISTSTPSSKLTVYGDALFEGSDRYLNFGVATGSAGYGFRDNAGTLEFKDSAGDWMAFNAMGGGGSTLGVEWATSTNATTYGNSVTYGNGLFVAVSNFGTGMTSPDGVNWTDRNISGGGEHWNSVTYGNGFFVAVGAGDLNFTGDRVVTSPDGINWTVRSAGDEFDRWHSVTYGNGLFVAVGAAEIAVITSPDGINWTSRSAAADDDSWYSVTYGNGLFVAVGRSGDDRVMTSPDGINWTAQSAAGNNDTWNSVTYGNGLFVAVGNNGDRVMTSPDGINWTAQSAAGDNDGWNFVTYGNGLFVAVGGSAAQDRVMTSPDGINWTAQSAAGNNDTWNSVTYGNGLFVAVSSSGDRVMYSGTKEKIELAHNNLYQGGLNVMGNVGIGTSTPSAQLTTTGTVRFANFGAGTLQTDASGNLSVSSDERLKDVVGSFSSGLEALRGLAPILYHWNELSGLDRSTIYTGFSAQNVKEFIPEAIGQGPNGFLTLSDRPILAAAVNAIKELDVKMEDLATTTAFADLSVDSFTKRFFDGLIAWFGDVGNGIGTMMASVFKASEMICVDDECLTADDIRQLKSRNDLGSTGAGNGDKANDSFGDDTFSANTGTSTASSTPPAASSTSPVIVDSPASSTSPTLIAGCMDVVALNHDPEATEDDGSCQYPVPQPLDETATSTDNNGG